MNRRFTNSKEVFMDAISFYGGETTGSISKRQLRQANTNYGVQTPRIETLQGDSVNFRGKEESGKKSSSFVKTLVGLAGTAAVVIGGLGLAHKYNVVGKLKDGKIKDFLKKSDTITEPCHKWCTQAKGYAEKGYEKIKSYFKKS